MKKIKSIALVFLSLCISLIMNAQPATSTSDFNSTMNSSGKIYVVIAVLTVILIGIFIYLIGIDRKVSRLEEKSKEV